MKKMFLNKKNKKLLIILSIVAVSILSFAGYRTISKEKSTVETDSRDIVEEKPKAEEGKETSPSVIPKENENSTQPFVKVSDSIQITKPVAGAKISEGIEVSGTVGNETGTLGYKIKSIQSGVIIDYLTNIEISKAGQSFNFSVVFEKEPIVGDIGNLEVYIIKNNQKIDSVSFEVKF